MANTIKLRRSAVQGAIPTTAQLQLGELALNTYDGKLYAKKSVSGTESIVDLSAGTGGGGGGGTGANQADYGLLAEAINSTADYGSIV
jgi:hypothetical protein